jgi:holo-[acyl-carrier protein] synthase
MALVPDMTARVLAVGVDVIETERIAEALDRFGERFLLRVYTDGELAYAAGRITALATRWAAKEAAAKALGTGIGAVNFNDIEVVCGINGKPELVLRDRAAQLAADLKMSHFALSLSHTRDYAVAFVVAQG